MDYENIQMTRISDLPDIASSSSPFAEHPSSFSGMSGRGGGGGGFNNENSNMYIPLNIHPSPYGISPPPPGGLSHPQQDQDSSFMSSFLPPSSNNMDSSSSLFSSSSTPLPPPLPSQPQPPPPPPPSFPVVPPPENMLPKITNNNVLPEHRLPSRDIPQTHISDFTHDEEIKPNYIPQRKVVKDFVIEHEKAVKEKMEDYNEEKRKEQLNESWFQSLHMPVIVFLLFLLFSLPIMNTLVFKRFAFLQIYREDGNFNMSGILFKSLCFAILYWGVEKLLLFFE